MAETVRSRPRLPDSVIARTGRRALRMVRRMSGQRTRADGIIRFLHIGKTAGTQVRHVIAQINDRSGREVIRRERHSVVLADLPPDAPYFFSIRDPVARFRSGFYSRKRKGAPRTYSEWSEAEARAFARFAHANTLAEALFSGGEYGAQALIAIKSIQHTYRNQVDWLDDRGCALLHRPPIWIIRQEHFDADLSVFLERIGHGAAVDLARGTRAHRGNYERTPSLSDLAVTNLRRWYAQDIAFYDACTCWMGRNGMTGAAAPAHATA